MGKVVRIASSFSTPADDTQYAAGDEVSSSATAGSVVRATFDMSGFTRGMVRGFTIGITPASGNLVITACTPEVLLFKTDDAPAAVGDNTTHPILAAVQRLAVGRYTFSASAWRNPLGATSAAASGIQAVTPAVGTTIAGHPFEFKGGETAELTAVVRVLGTWDAGAQIQAFTLDLEADVY